MCGFAAPEVVHAKVADQENTGRALDVWSSGVVLYFMLFGQYAFGAVPKREPRNSSTCKVSHLFVLGACTGLGLCSLSVA